MSESTMGLAWIYSQASTVNAPGGVHRGSAPVGTIAPWVVLVHQAGSDKTTHNGVRMFTESLFLVKAVGPASITQDVADIGDALDGVLFTNTVTAITGGYIHSCIREQPVAYDETPAAGIQFFHSGGLYRIQIEKA